MLSKKNRFTITGSKRYRAAMDFLREKKRIVDGEIPFAADSGGNVWQVTDRNGYYEKSADGTGLKAWSQWENGFVHLRPITDEVAADRTFAYLEALEYESAIPF